MEILEQQVFDQYNQNLEEDKDLVTLNETDLTQNNQNVQKKDFSDDDFNGEPSKKKIKLEKGKNLLKNSQIENSLFFEVQQTPLTKSDVLTLTGKN